MRRIVAVLAAAPRGRTQGVRPTCGTRGSRGSPRSAFFGNRRSILLRPIEFMHEGRRYRAEVRPVPDGGEEFAAGGWFVSVDDGPARRVFEVQAEDQDSPDLRHRLLIATWLAEGWERRSGAERRRRARDARTLDRRRVPDLGPWP